LKGDKFNLITSGEGNYRLQLLQIITLCMALFVIVACREGGITGTAREYEALSSDIEAVECAPVPASGPNQAISFNYTLKNDVNNVKIKIYDAEGAIIKNIEDLPIKKNSAPYGAIKWDLNDFRGSPVANGQYIYKLIYKKGENEYYKQGKLTVQR